MDEIVAVVIGFIVGAMIAWFVTVEGILNDCKGFNYTHIGAAVIACEVKK